MLNGWLVVGNTIQLFLMAYVARFLEEIRTLDMATKSNWFLGRGLTIDTKQVWTWTRNWPFRNKANLILGPDVMFFASVRLQGQLLCVTCVFTQFQKHDYSAPEMVARRHLSASLSNFRLMR